MSFDFQMIEHGPKTKVDYTSSVAPMFKAANPDEGIMVIQAVTGSRAVKPLIDIRNYMVLHRKEMEVLNPINGWGDYFGALGLLDRLIEIFQDFPDGEWKID